MADEIVKDYLGNPCKTAAAIAWYGELIEEARSNTRDDPRAIASNFSWRLTEVHERMERLITLLVACHRCLPADTDSDLAEAVIEATKDFATHTSNRLGELGALGLLALRHGNMWPDAQLPKEKSQTGKEKGSGSHLAVVTSEKAPQS